MVNVPVTRTSRRQDRRLQSLEPTMARLPCSWPLDRRADMVAPIDSMGVRPLPYRPPRPSQGRLFLGITLTKCFCCQKTTGWMRISAFSHRYGAKRVAHSLWERHQHDHLGAGKTD